MSFEQIVVGIGAIVVAALVYFAGVQRGKRIRHKERELKAVEREEDLRRERNDRSAELRRERTERVAETYVRNIFRSANFGGLLKADALNLADDEEIRNVCDRVVNMGHKHPIPESLRASLENVDLHAFLAEVSRDQDTLRSSSRMKELIQSIQGARPDAQTQL